MTQIKTMFNDNRSDESFRKYITPKHQVVYTLGLVVFFSILGYALDRLNSRESDPYVFWQIAISGILLFIIFNCVISFGSKEILFYWRDSIYGILAIMVLGGAVATVFSGRDPRSMDAVLGLYFVLAFSYLVFIAIVNLIRFIVRYAQNQET